MLIGNSLPEYVSIRIATFALRLVAPLSLAYCMLVPIIRPHTFFRRPLPLPLSIWMIGEVAFFPAVYLPLKLWLQRETVHPEPPCQEDRQQLLQRCIDSIPEPKLYLSRWFLDAPPAEIKQENVREFFAWSFMNKKYRNVDEEESAELDLYVDRLEKKIGSSLQQGRGKALSLRGTLDDVPMQHRPLIWYLIIFGVDCFYSMRLLGNHFRYYRPSLASQFAMFPFRMIPLLSWNSSPVQNLSYWYREHTSKTRLPIVFIHGIGVGLYTYVDFLAQLNSNADAQPNDGNVGIVAVEILPISSRICPPALRIEEMRRAIQRIVDVHGWDEFVLVGHSYGSAIAANILREPTIRMRVKAAVLMDPICFLLHLPDVCYNFTRRKPASASEHMLHYFSSQDMMISHTLARRFFWSEYNLWREDVGDLPLTVTLSGQDIIVPTEAVWNYLTDSSPKTRASPSLDGNSDEDTFEFEKDSLNVVWFEKFNHAGLFNSKGARRALAKAVMGYCEQSPDTIANGRSYGTI